MKFNDQVSFRLDGNVAHEGEGKIVGCYGHHVEVLLTKDCKEHPEGSTLIVGHDEILTVNGEKPKGAWEINQVQFARLIAEIAAVGLTEEQVQDLCISMDIEPHDLSELFDRAETEWQIIKYNEPVPST
jgi:hypothetical protein